MNRHEIFENESLDAIVIFGKCGGIGQQGQNNKEQGNNGHEKF